MAAVTLRRRAKAVQYLIFPVVAALVGTALCAVSGPLDGAGAQLTGPAAVSTVTGALPAAPGLGLARNADLEPGIAVDPSGTMWVASTIGGNDPRAGLRGALAGVGSVLNPLLTLSGSDIWRSTDGGRTYQWVADPFALLPGQPGLGGMDTDIAVADTRNSLGYYTVYAASLWGECVSVVETLPCFDDNISLAVSFDGGADWSVDQVAASLPLTDRPWLSGQGACTVYLTYHLAPTVGMVVDRYNFCDLVSTALGVSAVPLESTRYVSLLPSVVLGRPDLYTLAGFGKPALDDSPSSAHRGALYIPAMDCGPLALAAELQRELTQSGDCPAGTHAVVYVERSEDGGATWQVGTVAVSPSSAVPVWGVGAAVDAGGQVYLVWSDNHHAYLDRSSDGGATWSTPRRVNRVGTAVMPTVAAGAAGEVQLAYYATPASGDANDPAVMGLPDAAGAAAWRTYLSVSRDGGLSFTPEWSSPVVHSGLVCTKGDACAVRNGRDLFDDFGVVINPRDDLAALAYTSDQPQGDLAHVFSAYATQIRG